MLSSILTQLFRFAFILMVFFGIINTITQVRQKPFSFNSKSGALATFGMPGIPVCGNRIIGNEPLAPDTTIKYKRYAAPQFNMTSNGEIKSNMFKSGPHSNAWLDSCFKAWRKSGDSLVVDTQVCLILNMRFGDNHFTSTYFESLDNGKVVRKRENQEETKITIISDTFKDMRTAMIVDMTRGGRVNSNISQTGSSLEGFRIKPENRLQYVSFTAYYIAIMTCFAMVMLMLSRLFNNFRKKEFFTRNNIAFLRNIGWLLLIPELLKLLLYWTILVDIHPIKILSPGSGMDHAPKLLAQYDLLAGTEWQLIFLSLGLIILSHIFKSGLKLKEDLAYTI